MTGDDVKYVADAAAIGVTTASILGWLPSIAAVLTIAWMTIQIGTWFYDRIYKPWRIARKKKRSQS
jgi:hypothetical protein